MNIRRWVLSLSLSLSLSRSLFASPQLDGRDCQQSCRVGMWCQVQTTDDGFSLPFSLFFSLPRSHSLALTLSRPLALSPSLFRSRSSCLHNQDCIDGSCRLVLCERANGQWRLQRPVARCMQVHTSSSFPDVQSRTFEGRQHVFKLIDIQHATHVTCSILGRSLSHTRTHTHLLSLLSPPSRALPLPVALPLPFFLFLRSSLALTLSFSFRLNL